MSRFYRDADGLKSDFSLNGQLNAVVPSLIPIHNGTLRDFEITYADSSVPFSSCALATYTVRQSKSVKNALASFNRAVPGHGAIRRIRKVVT